MPDSYDLESLLRGRVLHVSHDRGEGEVESVIICRMSSYQNEVTNRIDSIDRSKILKLLTEK